MKGLNTKLFAQSKAITLLVLVLMVMFSFISCNNGTKSNLSTIDSAKLPEKQNGVIDSAKVVNMDLSIDQEKLSGDGNEISKAPQKTKMDLPIIDLTKLPENTNDVNMSQFASSITYIPLETKKECLVNGGSSFWLFDSTIVCCAHHQILIFDSKEGKFIRTIGEYGKGPSGYLNSKGAYLKKGRVIITAIGWKYPLIEFNAEGKILSQLQPQTYTSDIAWLSDNLYAIFYKKNSNSDSLRIQVYDSNKNKTISTFYDLRKFKDTPKFTMFGASFHYYRDKLFIKEYFNDTAFQITTKKLVPEIVFKTGKYSPPFYEKDVLNFIDYYNILEILRTDKLIFFQLKFQKRTYCCYFDNRTGDLMISNKEGSAYNGFTNDIDGFMPFQPESISANNELIGFLEAYQIKKWFDENPEKSAKLPEHLKKLKNINESDNPVLMVVKLKE